MYGRSLTLAVLCRGAAFIHFYVVHPCELAVVRAMVGAGKLTVLDDVLIVSFKEL